MSLEVRSRRSGGCESAVDRLPISPFWILSRSLIFRERAKAAEQVTLCLRAYRYALFIASLSSPELLHAVKDMASAAGVPLSRRMGTVRDELGISRKCEYLRSSVRHVGSTTSAGEFVYDNGGGQGDC